MTATPATRPAAVLILCLLAASAVAGESGPGRLQAGEECALQVPRMTAPTVDGAIGADEWRSAAAVGGSVDTGTDLLDPRPVTFFLGWDRARLFLACRAYLPRGYKPSISHGRSQHGATCFDDGLEMLFKPLGGNVSAEHRGTEFKLDINALGFGGDYTRLVVGQILRNWEPKPRAAARITAPGSAPDGGAWWELEVEFSNADFELVGDNKAGDRWLMMLGVNHLPKDVWMQARIPCMGGYFTPEGKCRITLVEDVPAVQLTMDSLANLANDGTASLALQAFNPSKSEATVKVDVEVAGVIARSAALVLPAGGSRVFKLDEKLPAGVRSGRVKVRASEGQNTLLAYQALFQVGQYPTRTVEQKPRLPDAYPFTATFNPLRQALYIQADTYFLPDPAAARALGYAVVRKADGTTVAKGEITRVLEWYFDELLKLDGLEPGDYEVTTRILLKDGRSFGPQAKIFRKKDEAKAFPEWWGKRSGDPDRVIPPFTPIVRREGDALACWGREYGLGALGLPTRIRSQGGDVLAGPARIVLTVGGKEQQVPMERLRITEARDWEVRFAGEAEAGGVAFRAEGRLEQDGMVTIDLAYRPAGGAKVRIDALRLEFPLADAVAECLVSVGTGNNYAAKTATTLPAGKQGRLWSTLDIGRSGSGMRVGSFYPCVWIGGDRRGLLWWADSDAGWFPDDEVPAHEAVRSGDAVVLRNHIIGRAADLEGPRTLRFSWMASPFKPLPKGWRMIGATDDGTFFTPFRGLRVNPRTGKKYWEMSEHPGENINWIHPESELPAEWSGLWAEQKAIADRHVKASRPFDLYGARTGGSFNHMSFQLIGYGVKSMQQELYDYFGEEWFPNGFDTWNPSYVNYATWLLDRAFREGGVVSTYWDLSFPLLCRSRLSGLAYQLPDGRVQPGYNSMNCRDFFRQLWAVQDRHGLNPGCTGSHSTNAYIFPSLPWISSVLDGERDWDLDVSDRDWIDYYPTDRMRSMSSPHNWGTSICWMGNLFSADRKKVVAGKTAQAEYLWMHDSWLNPYVAPAYHVTRMPRNVLDWGLNGEAVEYHPYWRNPFATCADPDVLVSLWRIPGESGGRILVGAFNYDRSKKKDIELRIDLARLGMKGGRTHLRDLYKAFSDSPLAKGGEPGGCEFWQGVVGDDALAPIRPGLGEQATYDPATGILRIKGLAPHRGRFVGIGAVDEAALAEAAKRLPVNLGDLLGPVEELGYIRPEARFCAAGSDRLVACADPELAVSSWRLPDRVLVIATRSGGEAPKDASIALDLSALGVAPVLTWQDFIGVRDVGETPRRETSSLDAATGALRVKAIRPNTTRLISIRRY